MTDFGTRYRAGVNLGGWLSQYPGYDHDHFESFIEEADIARIASWGIDHVRLPIDHPVIDGTGDGDRGVGYVDDCIRWCESHDLGVILDLHRAPGYSFDAVDENRLFDEPELQDRFVDLWRELAKRYESAGDEVAFELLNEIVESTSERWNDLAHRTVSAIREVDEDRYVIIGGNDYNSIDELDSIDRIEGDDRIVYTFHFYQPHLFTHQHAGWTDGPKEYGRDVEYPGEFPDLEEFLGAHPEYGSKYREFVGEAIDREWIETAMKPAIEFRERTGEDVYCGEYGVIDEAPEESRLRWHEDVVAVFREHGIGRACWSYKEMNFGLVDGNGEIGDEDLVGTVSRS